MTTDRKSRRRATESPLAKRWRVALAEANTTETQWAKEQGLSQSHVSLVMSGGRESKRLMRTITEFIEAQERALMARLSAA